MRIRQNLDRLCFEKSSFYNVCPFQTCRRNKSAINCMGTKRDSVCNLCVLQFTIAHFFLKKRDNREALFCLCLACSAVFCVAGIVFAF